MRLLFIRNSSDVITRLLRSDVYNRRSHRRIIISTKFLHTEKYIISINLIQINGDEKILAM